MNPKNALFLSASLTAFVLAILFGVVTKITTTNSTLAAAAVAPTVEVIAATDIPAPTQELPQPTNLPAATAVTPATPEEAALLAAEAIKRQDVYSVETFNYQGVDSYKVVFVSGDVVYIGLDKKVLEMTKLQIASTYSEPAPAPKKNHKNNNNPAPSKPTPNPKPPSDDHSDHSDDSHDN
ncbi:MAG: hypothetical protein WCK35_26160 [Chloroflexota bacterium]